MNEINTSKILLPILLSLVLTACGGSGSSGPADADGDGVPDASDAFPNDPKESKDTDGDGVGNNTDVFPSDPNETKDNDGDGLGDNQDPNDDNDAKLDNEDPFPFDATEWEDIDSDNIGDNKDLDTDSNNPSSVQLDRFNQENRATLFIGPETLPTTNTHSNVQVVNAGDVNGDGMDDLLIGVGEGSFLSGKVYLVFGRETASPEKIDLSNIPDSIAHIKFLGMPSPNFPNLIGVSITALGDVNGDNIDDFIMGGPGYETGGAFSYTGEAYLVLGRKTWLTDAGDDNTITMAELKSQYAITYQSQIDGGALGERVALAGDVNGDNINDFLISEYGYTDNGNDNDYTGRVNIMFGGPHLQPPTTPTSGIKNIDALPATERTVVITDRLATDRVRTISRETIIGDEVLGIGNFDNDANRYDDIAITSIHRQKTYVLFGQETWPASINLPTIENGKGFIFQAPAGIDDIGIGKHIAAGDLNGDNIPELIIAQTKSVDATKPNKLGDVVILKGGVGQWPATLSLDNLTNFFGTVWSTSEKLALGSGLAVLPDNNNDGFGELLIAAPKPESTGEGLIFKVAGNANLGEKELNSTTTDTGVEIIRNLSDEAAGENMRVLGDYNGDGINEFVIDIQDASTNGKGDRTSDDDTDPVRSENGLFYVIHGYSSLYPEAVSAE
ncbi:integrin alpha [Pseudomonas sp. HK3]